MGTRGLVLLGASRAGLSVARALEGGGLPLRAIWNRTVRPLPMTDPALLVSQIADVPELTTCVYVIAVVDDAIESVACDLGRAVNLGPGDIVCHLSGAMGLKPLTAACANGAYAMALHPLRSFGAPQTDASGLRGVYCGLECSDDEVLTLMRPYLENAGARIFEFPTKDRVRYHLSATASCNFLVTLFDMGMRHMVQAGVDEEVAHPMLMDLMKRTLVNIEQQGAAAALTGPVVRGDEDVVRKHLKSLRDSPVDRTVYRALAEATGELGLRDNRPAPEVAARILKILKDDPSCPS